MRRTILLSLVIASLMLLGGGRVFPWGGGEQVPSDFVTGGGFIFCTPSGGRGNFGVGGGVKNGAFWGHLNYLDHDMGLHVKGTSVTDYLRVGTDGTDSKGRLTGTRDICGVGVSNLFGDICYRVRVADNGEPGRNDHFGIRVTNCHGTILYNTNSTQSDGTCDLGAPGDATPAGGNIQLHKGNSSNVPPPPDSGDCHDA